MDVLMENPAFHTYAVCSAVLVIKMLLTGTYTAIQRMRNRGYVNDEDAKAFGGAGTSASVAEHPAVAHALRIQRNDVENIPVFFAIGLIYVLEGASAAGAAAYFWTFTIARLMHWVAYINHLQPWRTIAYTAGFLSTFGMAVRILL